MLKIENLHVSIDDKEILKGLSLDVKPGEIHAIMGPNGSGKSTLSSVIAGSEDYEIVKGNIFYNDENIEDLSACLLYTSPSPRDVEESRMPSSA